MGKREPWADWAEGPKVREVFRLGVRLGIEPVEGDPILSYAHEISRLTGIETDEGEPREDWAERQIPRLQELANG